MDISILSNRDSGMVPGEAIRGHGSVVELKRMSGGCFHTLSLVEFLQLVDDLHTRVARHHGRVEITRDGCDDVCILISKAELESLERALEILSDTADYRTMCQSLSQVASSSFEEAAHSG